MFSVKILSYTALGLFAVTLIFAVIYNNYLHSPKKSTPPITPVPTSFHYLNPTDRSRYFSRPDNNPDYNKSFEKQIKEEDVFIKRESQVGSLLRVLPYKGTDFMMEYDYKNLNFVVTINKERAVAGNTEFDLFLQQHGINNRTWIRNLNITTE